MYIGGLDIGTTGCKVVLYSEKGDIALTAYREYEVKRANGLHEVDIPAVWQAVREVLAECAPFEVAALGVTSFGETFVILDENDTPLAPSMLYTDVRGAEECAQIAEAFGAEALALKTGTLPHEMYSISKLAWLKNHMPEVLQSARHILLMQDYIVYLLSGVCQIDYSLAARTGAFDIRENRWLSDVFAFCGVDTALLAAPVPPGTVAGRVRPALAAELGITPTMQVVTGCQDQVAALVGASVLKAGEAMDGIGTVECVPIVLPEPPTDAAFYRGGYSLVPYINGNYACYVLSYAGGATLKWFRDKLAEKSYAELDAEVGDAPTDLLVMPHFAGAATPYMDISSRAAILGLTFEHTRADIYKALMEGTSFEILLNLERMKTIGMAPTAVTATGGGARSPVWLQIKADIFGIPVQSLDGAEIGAAGTALLAGRAIGVWDERMCLIGASKTYLPAPEKHAYYRKQYAKYAKLYRAVKEVLAHE